MMTINMIETNHLPLCETIQDVEDREKGEFPRKVTTETESESVSKEESANTIHLRPRLEGIDNPALDKVE